MEGGLEEVNHGVTQGLRCLLEAHWVLVAVVGEFLTSEECSVMFFTFFFFLIVIEV